ncbi:hypothetical protein CALCODRAFT_434063, partial [Calocera cornea HHB12733]
LRALRNMKQRNPQQIHFFGEYPYVLDTFTSVDPKTCTAAVAHAIWQVTGWRFTMHDHTRRCVSEGFTWRTRYWCSQDSHAAKHPKPEVDEERKPRDHIGMDRFDCQSHLVIVIKQHTTHTVQIYFQHCQMHLPYYDVRLPEDVAEYMRTNLSLGPSAIYMSIQRQHLGPDVTRKQVHSAWTRMSETIWRRSQNEIHSGQQLLDESDEVDHFKDLVIPSGVTMVAWAYTKLITSIGPQNIYEISLDATCELCYMNPRKAALTAFLQRLKTQFNIHPAFINTDKDMAEIGACRTVWPNSKHQICYWHLCDMIRRRLKEPRLATAPYDGKVANHNFSFIHPTFNPASSSDPRDIEGESTTSIADFAADVRGPNTVMLRFHTPAVLQDVNDAPPVLLPQADNTSSLKIRIRLPPAPSQNMLEPPPPEQEPVRRVFCPEELRRPILDMVQRHATAHPSIPSPAAPDASAIHYWATKQMYAYCVKHDLREVWAYMWTNHYQPSRWSLWARCEAEEIPRLRTTMISESHFRLLKHNFLKHNSKPRVDYLIWLLLYQLVPHLHKRFTNLMDGRGRSRGLEASWRREFKRDWRRCANALVSEERTMGHYTHVVHMVHPPTPRFFKEVTRYRKAPVWRHAELIPIALPLGAPNPLAPTEAAGQYIEELYQEQEDCGTPIHESDDDSTSDIHDTLELSDDDSEWDSQETNGIVNPMTFDSEFDQTLALVDEFRSMLLHQKPFREARWLQNARSRMAPFIRMVEELHEFERHMHSTRLPRPNTWDVHSRSTLFYHTRPSHQGPALINP